MAYANFISDLLLEVFADLQSNLTRSVSFYFYFSCKEDLYALKKQESEKMMFLFLLLLLMYSG